MSGLLKLMWLLKSPLNQNSIVIYRTCNYDFKAMSILKRLKEDMSMSIPFSTLWQIGHYVLKGRSVHYLHFYGTTPLTQLWQKKKKKKGGDGW